MTDHLPVRQPKDPNGAARMRRHRAKKRALTVTGPVTGDVTEAVARVTDVTYGPVCRDATRGRFLGVVLAVTGLSLGATGLVLNATYAASLGQSPAASIMLGALGAAVDVLAVLLPATGSTLWHRGRRGLGLVAWCIWPLAVAMVLLSATGFAAGNLGDSIAGRERDAAAAVDSRAELDRLRGERATIAEARSTGEIEAAIARTRVAPWALPCTSPDSSEARRACGELLKLRAAKFLVTRRDALDAQIRDIEARLAALPSVGLADPTSFADRDLGLGGPARADGGGHPPHQDHRARGRAVARGARADARPSGRGAAPMTTERDFPAPAAPDLDLTGDFDTIALNLAEVIDCLLITERDRPRRVALVRRQARRALNFGYRAGRQRT
jgi:hypothetical protein